MPCLYNPRILEYKGGGGTNVRGLWCETLSHHQVVTIGGGESKLLEILIGLVNRRRFMRIKTARPFFDWSKTGGVDLFLFGRFWPADIMLLNKVNLLSNQLSNCRAMR